MKLSPKVGIYEIPAFDRLERVVFIDKDNITREMSIAPFDKFIRIKSKDVDKCSQPTVVSLDKRRQLHVYPTPNKKMEIMLVIWNKKVI